MNLYRNTPENAAEIGWLRLDTLPIGNSTEPYVLHDHYKGVFIYVSSGYAEFGFVESICHLVKTENEKALA